MYIPGSAFLGSEGGELETRVRTLEVNGVEPIISEVFTRPGPSDAVDQRTLQNANHDKAGCIVT